MTLLLILLLVALLIAMVLAMSYWMTEGGFFGFWMAWHLAEGIGHIFAALIAAVASCFHQD